MKASARNQLHGTVTGVEVGAVTVEVTVLLDGGGILVAALTRESANSLGIQPGTAVLALIKAPLVMVVKDYGGYRLSARNQLQGTVSRLTRGGVSAEVLIRLPGGQSIAAIITNGSVDALGLQEGDTATAVFKAGAVILGVADR
jgi:molybdate transport system regulatory protein